MTEVQTGTVTTKVPARLDRLPWFLRLGITGPLLFSSLVSSGKVSQTVLAFTIGAVLMIAAGLVEVFLGVKAERKSLEDIAQPLTATDAPTARQRTGSW